MDLHVAPWPALVLIAVLQTCVLLYERFRPVPSADLTDIELFLRNRGEQLAQLRNKIIWVGGPLVRTAPLIGLGPRIFTYKVIARSSDGTRWVHVLALKHGGASSPRLWQLTKGTWQSVAQ